MSKLTLLHFMQFFIYYLIKTFDTLRMKMFASNIWFQHIFKQILQYGISLDKYPPPWINTLISSSAKSTTIMPVGLPDLTIITPLLPLVLKASTMAWYSRPYLTIFWSNRGLSISDRINGLLSVAQVFEFTLSGASELCLKLGRYLNQSCNTPLI